VASQSISSAISGELCLENGTVRGVLDGSLGECRCQQPGDVDGCLGRERAYLQSGGKTNLISWDSANAEAVAAGGYLATITSAEENSFIFALIDDPAYWTQSANDHGPWIGGYQPPGSSEPAGGWTWVTAPGALAPEAFAFTNWEAGEPNNLEATIVGVIFNQDRMAFFHSGTGRAPTWSDEYNSVNSNLKLNQWTKSYVIEFGPPPPANTNPELLADGSFQFAFTNTPGISFDVMTTTNLTLPLTNWVVLGSATEISPGQFQFTDSQATNSVQRFYRVKSR
jgi:hypothetical protein